MKTDLSGLPAGKQRELRHLVDILLEEFGKVVASRKAPRLKNGQVLKIILFGSYARGDWVEDPIGRYFSDYDLLIVVDHDDLADTVEFWDTAEARILKELADGEMLRTPVNFIVHSLQDVNDQLQRGRYFFADILRDGILLHNLQGHRLAIPAELSPRTALDEATTYFEDGMESAERRIELAAFAMEKGYGKEAAFELHQAAEWLYNTLLLTLTLYTPKSHNLVRLRNLAEPLDDRLTAVWPHEGKFEKRSFELLRAAYIKARYSRHYRITAEELAWLGARVNVLREVVSAICSERLGELNRLVAAE
ncbi:MAG: nucleotidyltransferase [Phenylobacterium sp. RIFCSPHIGHO2_01_FULL_69_31]|uniref:HEPN domain-containing protein n=1 Tax=Phenylobacterium sp. RIFCSPHIGHO2_01_FULL_69_31 TaxID=1801944 RepID=UPI0008D83F6B|nr:HEPN domain-containing protein [Phenylobacterium sp. RIFCSPHIGHO2_01_FULL_69_31]OHB31825.1 MAG: nucleotidyltransferase [Phenylobacterium sp. RIFCSPHIGHO2_01_FULL_69_31]